MIYSNGEIYEGEWGGGVRSGEGFLYRTDGKVYEGMWRNDEPEGEGKICFHRR